MKSFASDNWAGVHPKIMLALQDANAEHAPAYGEDALSKEAVKTLQRVFETEGAVLFVSSGTAANGVSLRCLARSYNTVFCSPSAHLYIDECSAPETQAGCKLIPIPTPDGKLRIADLKNVDIESMRGMVHAPLPRAISLTQCTENGLVYTIEELKAICDWAHSAGLFVHMDGARLPNAAAYLNCELVDITTKVGVDVLSLGAIKNGAMFGEAVLILNPTSVEGKADYIRMNSMQLNSKMRFIAAQMQCLFGTDLWRENARHSNAMAKQLAEGFPFEKLYPVEANIIFARIPATKRQQLQEKFPFYTMSERDGLCRLVTAFDTTPEEVDAFLTLAQ